MGGVSSSRHGLGEASWPARRRLCLNYVISDSALPIAEHCDAFTAQQVASLKPIAWQKRLRSLHFDEFFVYGRFPNFDINRHRMHIRSFDQDRSKTGLKRFSCRTHPECWNASAALFSAIFEEEGRRAIGRSA